MRRSRRIIPLAGVYDLEKEEEVTGTLTKIKFVNPHGSMTITVKNADGTTTDWTFTTGSATALAERGISKVGPNALKIGEQLTAKFIPARNGSPLGVLKTIKRADGTVVGNPAQRQLVNRASTGDHYGFSKKNDVDDVSQSSRLS